MFFFFNDTATTEIYTLSLHDALPIWVRERHPAPGGRDEGAVEVDVVPDEDRTLDELLETGHDLRDGRRLGDHAIRDAGQAHDEGVYLAPRIDQRRELFHYHPVHELEGAELGDGAALPRRGSRGLHVEDHVRGLLERERGGIRRPEIAAVPDEAGVAAHEPLHAGAGVAVGVREGEELRGDLFEAHRLAAVDETVEARRHGPQTSRQL